jgi:glycosyltransferase involved in cell wall biosynthesis
MKIIQITPYFYPKIGGLENVVKELSEYLAKKGHQVEVFTSDIECPKDQQFKSTKNLKINYLPAWEFAHTPIIFSLFWKLMKIPQDSIMHVHISQAFVPEIVWLVSKIRKIPYVTHIHTDIGPSGKLGFLLPFYKRFFLKRVLTDACKTIVLNKCYLNLISSKYNTTNLFIIPNGISKNFIFKKDLNIDRKINLLYVGRLTGEKNVPKLIEAISLLKNKTILNIIGDGEKEQEIKRLINEKGLGNIFLHGRKIGNNLLKFYQSATIFLLASDYEGQPLVLLEAMATGTPIIASDVIGIRDTVSGIGILVNPPTAENFAKEIDNLINDLQLRKKLAENGLKEVKKYSWDKIVEQTEQVYKEVLREHKHANNKK